MIRSFRSLNVGFTLHPEATVLKGGSFRKIPFPAKVSIIEHKKYGVILFDTGYSAKFQEYTKSFPECIYAWITPVNISQKEICVHQLKNFGIKPEDVSYIIISHFHADHIGGLRDFPNAKFIFYEDAMRTLWIQGRFKKVLNGFIPQFLPDYFLEKSHVLKKENFANIPYSLLQFKKGWDIFNDESIWAIPLPGHAPGHIGLFFEFDSEEFFLISDAVWTEKALMYGTLPSKFALSFMDSKPQYQNTLQNLHHLFHNNVLLKRKLNILPCHCPAISCEKNSFGSAEHANNV